MSETNAHLTPETNAAPRPPATRASDAERGQTAALLKQACVEGRLNLDEFGQRVAEAYAARTRDELAALTSDLPAGQTAPVLARSAPPAVTSTTAILAAAERSGPWRVGESGRVLAVLGACKLDLRQATVTAPVTTIDAKVVLGNLVVLVPEGVEVDLAATAVMGARTLRLRGPAPPPGAPVVRITGVVVWGDLSVRDRVESG
jgi:hypothetical protein